MRKTKAGFQAVTFELMGKTYLATFIDLTSLEHFVAKPDEEAIFTVLGTMLISKW